MIRQRPGKISTSPPCRAELGGRASRHTRHEGRQKNLTWHVRRWAKSASRFNAVARGYFKTQLTRRWSNIGIPSWLEKRTPAGRWGKCRGVVGDACVPSGNGVSPFVNGHTLLYRWWDHHQSLGNARSSHRPVGGATMKAVAFMLPAIFGSGTANPRQRCGTGRDRSRGRRYLRIDLHIQHGGFGTVRCASDDPRSEVAGT